MTEKKGFSTDREITALKPRDVRYKVSDKTRRGLYIEVYTSGVKSWNYRYSLNGKQERILIGKYPAIKLIDARNISDAAAVQVAQGISPLQQRKQKVKAVKFGLTLREYGEKYFKDVICAKRAKPKTMRMILDNDIFPMLGNKLLQDITKDDVREVIWRKKDQGYDAAAAAVHGLLKRMFDYAVNQEIVEINPVRKIKSDYVFKQVSRDRVLTIDEIKRFYTMLLDSRIYRSRKLGLLLSLLTLVRKNELLNAKWEHIDFENKVWNIPVTKNTTNGKNSRPMIVFMSNQIVDIFKELKTIAGDEPYVFCGRQRGTRISHNVLNSAQKSAMALADVPHFTIHDLRRTASTHLNEQGFHADAIEACLNHSIVGTRGTYNKAIYWQIRTEIIQKWSDYIYTIIYEPNVIFFNTGQIRTAQ